MEFTLYIYASFLFSVYSFTRRDPLLFVCFLACFLYTSLCEFRIRSIEKVHKFWLIKLTCTLYISPNTDNLYFSISFFILFYFSKHRYFYPFYFPIARSSFALHFCSFFLVRACGIEAETFGRWSPWYLTITAPQCSPCSVAVCFYPHNKKAKKTKNMALQTIILTIGQCTRRLH